MQLSKVVGAILNDLSKAQDLANDYSSQLSHKYKKKQVENKDDNILSNFQVPAVVLREISFDLKFVIKEINLVEKETKELEELCLNSTNIISDDEIDIKTIIQKVRGSPNTEVIFDLETLQNMPTEVIQSLRISANYDNYQWTISEGGQSFYKT